jgi:flagellar P-ring protein precursor FlgI
VLQLRNPDFSTAVGWPTRSTAMPAAQLRRGDGRIDAIRMSVYIAKPKGVDLARLMAEIENLTVETDVPARVVINERTGTIVIGQDVKISQVAVSYGTLTVQVNEMPQVVQPAPFSRRGDGGASRTTDIYRRCRKAARSRSSTAPDLRTLVSGLNSIGVKPDGIISILQGIKSAGALQAELVLQ